jgi:2-polyprenyl-3-methyl-5-hydroxy-6-metoxy-1,4-benzoquinol methylase
MSDKIPLGSDTDAVWEYYGRVNPYYGVITHDEYRKDNMTDEQFVKFFETGESYISEVFETIRVSLDSGFKPARALDFGCGVGRILIPLAKRCASVVGVDVSDPMIAEALKNCAQRGVSNVEVVCGDDLLSNVKGKFDFIHSYIVFQHLQPARGESITGRLVDMLDDGGVGMLHYTYLDTLDPLKKCLVWAFTYVPLAFRIMNILRKRRHEPIMQVNHYNLNNLLALLQQKGCHNISIRFTAHGSLGVMVFFQKRKLKLF